MKVTAFFAHPDDETMLVGGVLALLAMNGAKIHYLCATRGEGGEAGDPPICERDQLGDVREKEMTCAVHALGGGTLEFLDYKDPLVGEGDELFAYTDDLSGLSERAAEFINRYSPEAVITHGSGGEYGHPAHIITHQAARNVVQRLNAVRQDKDPIRLYTVQAAFQGHPKPRLANEGEPAHLVLDVQSVLERKIQAALCHRSQHALFVRRASRDAGRIVTVPEVITALESLHRALPDQAELQEDSLFNLLKPWEKSLDR